MLIARAKENSGTYTQVWIVTFLACALISHIDHNKYFISIYAENSLHVTIRRTFPKLYFDNEFQGRYSMKYKSNLSQFYVKLL